MLIRGLTQEQLQDAASKAKVTLYEINCNGTGFRFQLKPFPTNDGRNYWQRYNHTHERKVWAVCWHGHKAFYDEVFKINPGATIITAIARYNGEQNYQETFGATGDKNIGSMMEPCAYRDACDYDTHRMYVDDS